MKNIIPYFVVGILVLSGIGAVATIEDKTPAVPLLDEIDQYQEVMTENAFAPVGQIPIPENPVNVQVAQSFIPGKDVITRVEIYIGKNSTATYPIIISVREELTEGDLTTESVDPSLVPTEEFGWVEIDLPDILITTGQTYYLVAITENTTENYYAWGANNESESYPSGCAWFSVDDGESWTNESASTHSHNIQLINRESEKIMMDDPGTWDMCFKTYGETNDPPDIPTIEGPTSGKAGVEYDWTFYSIDPNDHNLYYWIDWGDDSPPVEWAGEFSSGEHAVFSHTYSEQGEFEISAKAKDIYDLEGDWAYLKVTMPRARAIYHPLLHRILEQYPILKYVLGL